MYFTEAEVKLIREVAKAMPVGGFKDPGRSQLSSLADIAEGASLGQVVMDIEARELARPPKLQSGQARALCELMRGIELTDYEIAQIPPDPLLREKAGQMKRANALRYANKLRREPADRARAGRPRGGA
jgi:hypothetical protein